MPDLKMIETALDSLLAQEAMELVDLRWLQEGSRWILRVYADKHGGIGLDDCEYLSGRIGAFIDETDAIRESYILEVSSPGIDRVLKKEKDFARFEGHRVRMRLKLPVDGQRNFQGQIRGVVDGRVVVDAGNERTFQVRPDEIEEARLIADVRP
ncbi:MAG: ribosome maturation factor RimP [Elusimicrobiota bacterium]|jgi:ribosome maturation factor RimP